MSKTPSAQGSLIATDENANFRSSVSKDATFKDFKFRPGKAGQFLQRVQTEMFKAMKSHGGDIVARMEISGTSVAPNYRLERSNGKPLFVINGVGHKQFSDDAELERNRSWSSVAMSFPEVSEGARSAFCDELEELQSSSFKARQAKAPRRGEQI